MIDGKAVAAIQLLDSTGNVITNVPVEKGGDSAPRKEFKLPSHLDWYRDATKWFVATSGGAIVFGFGTVADGEVSAAERWLFVTSSFILLASILGGILCHLWILRYANAVETLDGDVSEDLRIRLKSARKSGRKWVPIWYYVMMWGFLIGMAVFSAFGWLRVAAPKITSPPLTVVPVNTTDTVAAVVDPKTRRTWLLRRVGSELRWQELAVVPSRGPAKP